MLKKVILMTMIASVLVGLIACSSETYVQEEFLYGESENLLVNLADPVAPERKIIYEVKVSYDVTDLPAATAFLKAQLQTDEWFDREVLTSGYHSYVIRVKTERLDAFITTLHDEFALRSYEKIGTDISLEYQDTSNRIISLQTQLARLLVLYESATLAEMLVINEQISDIEVELAELDGTLSEFDSLAEYSEVALIFYGGTVVTQSPFFNRLGNAVWDGILGLLDFFDTLFIAFATILPFLIVFGGIGIIVWRVIKKRKAKKQLAAVDKAEKQ